MYDIDKGKDLNCKFTLMRTNKDVSSKYHCPYFLSKRYIEKNIIRSSHIGNTEEVGPL